MKEFEPNNIADNEAQAKYRTMLTMVAEQQSSYVTRNVIEAILPWYVRGHSYNNDTVKLALNYIQNPLVYGLSESQKNEMACDEPVLKLADAWNCVQLAEASCFSIANKEKNEVFQNAIKGVEKLRKNAMDLVQTTDLSGVSDIDLKKAVDRFTEKE